MTQPKDTQNEANPINISCPFCLALPGHKCSDEMLGVLEYEDTFHVARVEIAKLTPTATGPEVKCRCGHSKDEHSLFNGLQGAGMCCHDRCDCEGPFDSEPTAIGPEEDFFAEPQKVPGKHRFMAGTCVDCGKPFDKVCKANPEPTAIPAQEAKSGYADGYAQAVEDHKTMDKELLESLEIAYTTLTEEITGHQWDEAVEIVYAAIAKAKGITAPPEVKK